MSKRIVIIFIKRFGTAITKDGDNSEFPLKGMFLKMKDMLSNVRLGNSDEIDDVRESVYELEELLSQCQALSRKRIENKQRRLPCYTPSEFFFLNKTRIKLRKIKKKLQALQNPPGATEHHEKESRTEEPHSVSEYQWSYGAVDVSNIYGWEKDVEAINELLLKNDQKGLNMVGIVGNFGTGKTTLAHKIFMSEKVMDEFCLRLWVCVSPDCTREELVRRMLDGLGVEDEIVEKAINMKGDRNELGVLLFLLHLQLLDKRYLIVFDDISELKGDMNDWHIDLNATPSENEEWTNRLGYGLPKGEGSAVIVTSRVYETARKMVGRKNIRHPSRMSEANGWLLFKTSFEEANGHKTFNEKLELLKKEIITKCDGLPLALIKAAKGLANGKANIFDDVGETNSRNEQSTMTIGDDKDKPQDGDTEKPKEENPVQSTQTDISESKAGDEIKTN
ncbi:hypothetical protein ACHQM5_003504 [Ranunculus cassubicifolius]